MKLLLQKLKFRTRYNMSRAIYFYLSFLVFILFSQTALSQVCTSEAVEVGYRDYNYGKNVTPKVTAEKPESKLWYNNGWWGVLWDPDNKVFRIQQFDLAKQCWQNVGPDVDDRPQSAVDVFWDGQKLYIASHANADHKSGSQNARLYRYRYDANSNSYTLDNGFPVDMNNKKSETLVITKDSTGQLWATWTQRGKVYVNRSLGDDKTWGSPFVLPVDHVSASKDDISSVTLFGNGDIGVMWSNQNDKKIYFSVHKVNNADDDWEPTETALAGVNAAPVADDHINLAATCAGDGSTVVAVTKSSLRNATDPQIFLLKRDPAGNWSNHTVGTDKEGHTRPIVLCQANSDKVYVFLRAKKPVRSRIYLKTAHLANPKFKEGMGEIYIDSRNDNDVNNPTSTKQHVDANTGILVLASDDTHTTYLHNYMNLDGGPDTFLLTTSVSPSGGGSIERDPNQTNFEDGDTVKLTAKAETGFVFQNWSGDIGSADASSQTITLTMDQNRSVVAHFSETPVADIDVDPTAHDYGTVAAGDNSPHTFKVTNVGTANLLISSVSLTGSNPNVFSIDSGGGAFDLNPSESRNVVVSFRPNSVNMKSATLHVTSSDPDESDLDIPLLGNQPLPLCEPGVNLALSGEATASSGSRRVHQGIDGDLDSSWKSDRLRARNKQQWYQIDFLQTVTIGQVVIRWTTNRHAKSYLLQVSNDGDNWTDIFNQTNGDNIIEEVSGLNALGRYLRLFMTENNRSRYGIRELEIFCSNDPPLAGQPDIAIKPDKHNFGSLDIGGSASKTLVVSNDGTKQLHVSDIFLTGSNKNEFVIDSGGGAFDLNPSESRNV
ncbi:MAG: choice-of-anchor D domain-containing protein, partial [bacterium]